MADEYQVIQVGNIFENIPSGEFPEEIIEILAQNSSVRIERVISKGHASPKDFWYDQEQAELVCVLQGQAELEFQTEEGGILRVPMTRGSHLTIRRHQKHRVVSTSSTEPCVWLTVFF